MPCRPTVVMIISYSFPYTTSQKEQREFSHKERRRCLVGQNQESGAMGIYLVSTAGIWTVWAHRSRIVVIVPKHVATVPKRSVEHKYVTDVATYAVVYSAVAI